MKRSARESRRALLQAGAMGLGGLALAGAPLQDTIAGPTTAGLRAMYSKDRQFGTQHPDGPMVLSPAPDASVRALRRLTFGYRPQDLVDFQALGTDFEQRLVAWVDAQLNGYQPGYPPLGDPPLSAVLDQPETNFETLGDSLATLWQERVVAAPEWPFNQYPLIETQYLTLIRAIYSQWQLAEVLADFWHTHFSIHGDKFIVASMFVHFDRDVIRPHMLGNFRQLLEAVATSTSMMYYLDNVWNSVYGPNENYAREVQELHTLGAVNSFGFTPEGDIPVAVPLAGSGTVLPAGLKAGYSEVDVRQLTLCLTGWSISNDSTDRLDTGEFIYYPLWHDTSAKRVLGIDIGATGQGEAQQVFDLLALHPATARFVCTKLCRRLIGDDPPASIVEQAAVVFNDQWQAADQLEQVVRTIILSSEFKDVANWGAKTKRPFELMAGAMRSCDGLTVNLVRPEPVGDYYVNLLLGKSHKFSQDLHWRMSEAGHMPFGWVTPDGFPDNSPAWLGSTPLIMGWRQINGLFIDSFPDDPAHPQNSSWHEYYLVDAVTPTKNALAVNQRTAANIVDHWLRQILGYDSAIPGSPQIDAALRNTLVSFMQQDAARPDTVLDLDANGYSEVTWSAYISQRLQTLVASIVMLPDNMLR